MNPLQVLESPGTLFLLAFITHPRRTKLAAALVGGAYVVPDDTVKFRVARLGLVAAAAITMYPPAKPFINAIKEAYKLLEEAYNAVDKAAKNLKKDIEDYVKKPEDLITGEKTLNEKVYQATGGEGTYAPGREGEEALVKKVLQLVTKIRESGKKGKPFTPTREEIKAGFGDAEKLQKTAESLASAFKGFEAEDPRVRPETSPVERASAVRIRAIYMANRDLNGRAYMA